MVKKKTSAATRRFDALIDHRRWLARAEAVAEAPISKGGSPHPTVRVGAILVDARGREIASAANRFPEGVDRRRAERYKSGSKSLWINCAEQLALIQALRHNKKTVGARLYVTLEPCAICAGMIGELKIAEVIVPVGSKRRYAKLKTKWKHSIEVGMVKLAEAGTRLVTVDTQSVKSKKSGSPPSAYAKASADRSRG